MGWDATGRPRLFGTQRVRVRACVCLLRSRDDSLVLESPPPLGEKLGGVTLRVIFYPKAQNPNKGIKNALRHEFILFMVGKAAELRVPFTAYAEVHYPPHDPDGHFPNLHSNGGGADGADGAGEGAEEEGGGGRSGGSGSDSVDVDDST